MCVVYRESAPSRAVARRAPLDRQPPPERQYQYQPQGGLDWTWFLLATEIKGMGALRQLASGHLRLQGFDRITIYQVQLNI